MRAALIACVCLLVGFAWHHQSSLGQGWLSQAQAAFERGDSFDGVAFAHAAASARCPGCQAPRLARRVLEDFASQAERRGEVAAAFEAWGAIRSSEIASEWGGPQERAEAERELARLGSRIANVASGGHVWQAATEARLGTALADATRPGGLVFAAVGGGGLVFVFFSARFVRRRQWRDAAASAVASVVSAAALLFL